MSWVSSAWNGVKDAAASIDPTANSSALGHLLGPKITGVIKDGVASSAVVVTGGAALLVKPNLKDSAIQGFAIGASGVGGAIGALSKPLPRPTAITINQPSTQGTANDPLIAVPASKLKTLALFGLAFLVILLVARED